MNDNQSGTYIELDILSLNQQLRQYLSLQLSPFWKKAEEMLNNTFFHIAIGKDEKNEENEVLKWQKIKKYLNVVTPEEKSVSIEIDDDNMYDLLKESVYHYWDVKDDKKVFFKSRNNVKDGATGSEKTENVEIGEFEICWCIQYTGKENTTVIRLIMELILEFLCTSMSDIEQLKENGKLDDREKFAKIYSTDR